MFGLNKIFQKLLSLLFLSELAVLMNYNIIFKLDKMKKRSLKLILKSDIL